MPSAFIITPELLPGELNVSLTDEEGASVGLSTGQYSTEIKQLAPPAINFKEQLLLAVVREGIARGLIIGRDLT